MRARSRSKSDRAAIASAKPSAARVRASPKAPAPANMGKPEVRIFVSYSHDDEPARVKLETHLATLARDRVVLWFDGTMKPGDELDPGIRRALEKAHIFVALVTPEYLHSDYCWRKEYQKAMRRRARGTMHVVPAIVRACDWKATRMARFKLLPRDARPVSRWRNADDAYLDIAEGIRTVVKAVRKELVDATMPPRRKKKARAPLDTARPAKPSTAAAKAPGRGRTKPPPRGSPRART